MFKKLNHGYTLNTKSRMITKIRPYDEAQYYFAYLNLTNENTAHVFKHTLDSSIFVKTIEFDDINEVADELAMANSAIKEQIVHY